MKSTRLFLLALFAVSCGGIGPRQNSDDSAPVCVTATNTATNTAVTTVPDASVLADDSGTRTTPLPDTAPDRIVNDDLAPSKSDAEIAANDAPVAKTDSAPLFADSAPSIADARQMIDTAPVPQPDTRLGMPDSAPSADTRPLPDLSVPQPDAVITPPPQTKHDAKVAMDAQTAVDTTPVIDTQPPATQCLKVGIAPSAASVTAVRGSTVTALAIDFTACPTSDVTVTDTVLRILMNGWLLGAYANSGTVQINGHVIKVTDIIQHASIWDGNTQLGSASLPNSSGDVGFHGLAWLIAAGTTKTLTVKVTLKRELADNGDWNYPSFIIDLIGDGTAGNSTASIIARDDRDNAVTTVGANPDTWSADDYHLQIGTAVNSPDSFSGSATTIGVKTAMSGQLTVKIDASTPASAILSANTVDNTVTRLKFSSLYEGFVIPRLTVVNTNPASSRSITSVRLFDQNAQLFCSGALDNDSRLRCANDGGLFTVNGEVTLAIKVNIDQEGSGTTGANSGDMPVMALYVDENGGFADDIKAVGLTSGTVIADADARDMGSASFAGAPIQILDDQPAVDQRTAGTPALVSGKPFVIYKTEPTIATVATSTALQNGEVTLIKLSVTAGVNADVALRLLTLAVNSLGITVNALRVYENGALLDPTLYSITNAAGADITGTASNLDTAAAIGFKTERIVPASTTKTYEVKGTVYGAHAGDFIATCLNGDAERGSVVPGTIDEVLNGGGHNLIWSDTSADAHSATAEGTAATGTSSDWENGYLVKTLPTVWQFLSL
jgi:hypothetical protein